MGLFNIFKKSKQDDDIATEVTPTRATPTLQALTPEEIQLKASKDLAKLKSFEETIQEKEKVRTTTKQDNTKTERPEEKRAREALSINNPFRGV